MKTIAPDIDQLMWTLAEARDMAAVEEFEQRFPELRLELAKRVALVGGLRGARFEEGSPARRFQPSAPPQPLWGRPLALAGALAVLGAIAFGTFSGTRAWLEARSTGPEPVSQESLSPAPPLEAPVTSRTFEHAAPPSLAAPSASTDPQEAPPFLKRMSVKIEDAPLTAVVQAIAAQSGLSLEIAPGMPDFVVSVAYTDQIGVNMLQDLGRRYGFSVLGQGGNRVLIVPVVDESQPSPSADPGPSSTHSSPTGDGH